MNKKLDDIKMRLAARAARASRKGPHAVNVKQLNEDIAFLVSEVGRRNKAAVVNAFYLEGLNRSQTEIKGLKAALVDAVAGFKDIRKYSLGSKADTCDEFLTKHAEIIKEIK